MLMQRKYYVIIFCLTAALYACSKADIPSTLFAGFVTHANFPQPAYHFDTNPVTKEGFELGRKLFYEPLLSANNTISCGSCHVQTSAFTHHGHTVSHGIYDRMGTRNAPPIMNLAWNTSFMWDGGIADMDLQSIAPITNHVEMDENMANVLQKLRNSPAYPAMFQKAFGTGEINTSRFLKAISQFMAMCVSSNSRYDSVVRMQGASFTMQENSGYHLVQQKCAPCHQEPLFTDISFRNNGLVPGSINDSGRFAITHLAADMHAFKVPSLRNLSYTAPYMHDGRFFTLDAVLEHYSTQISQSPTLDPQLSQGIPLTTDEKQNIIAFLHTLDDRSFLLNKMLSEQ